MIGRVRRLGSLLLPFVCVPVALAVVAACEDDSGSGGSPGLNLDSSIAPFDGSSPIPPNDGGDAGPSSVTIRVRDRANQPIIGASVIFGSAAGDIIQTLQSDSTGSASLEVPAGSQVTVAFGTETAPRLLTVTSVEPGDDIIAVAGSRASDAPPMNIAIAESPDGGPGVTYYYFSTGSCGDHGTPPLEYPVDERCLGPDGKFPVLVEGTDTNGALLGFQFAKGLTAVPDGGTVTPTFGPWSTAVTQQTVVGSNLTDSGASNTLSYGEIVNGVLSVTRDYVDLPDDGGATAASTFQGRTGYGEAAQWDVTSRRYVDEGVTFVGNAVRGAVPAANATTTVDFGSRLPEITESSFDGGARPLVSWKTAGSLASADGTYVVLRWSEEIDAGYASGSWTFIVPPGATSVAAPALPPGVRAPGAAASFSSPARVVTVEASFVNGYAPLRRLAGALHPSESVLEDNGYNFVPALPIDGTVRFTAYTRNGD
jgi:hypothetical protein